MPHFRAMSPSVLRNHAQGADTHVPQELTDDQKIAVFRATADAWHRKDRPACAGLLAPDGVLQSMMLEPVEGRGTFPERSDEVEIDGMGHRIPVVGVLAFRGPLISLWHEHYDRTQLLRAQGKTVALHVTSGSPAAQA